MGLFTTHVELSVEILNLALCRLAPVLLLLSSSVSDSFLEALLSGRLVLLAWLPVCIVGKGNEYHLYWLHPLKHTCTICIRSKIVNPCSNFPFLTCRLLLVGFIYWKACLLALLSTFSISLRVENIDHKPSLDCLLRSSNREPSSSVCPYLLSRFCSHQIY